MNQQLDCTENSVALQELNDKSDTMDNEIKTAINAVLDADKAVNDTPKGGGFLFPDIAHWHKPVDGGALLDDIVYTIKRFVVCSNETAITAALWTVMTWFIDVIQVAPLAMITAPEKRCGKTRLLEIFEKLCYRPLMVSSITAAAIFRTIEAYQPTLLIDETDAFLKNNEEARGIINSGHTRDGAYVIRAVRGAGDNFVPQRFSTWGAKALSGINNQELADTITDRSVILKLRRKLKTEKVEHLRRVVQNEPTLFSDMTSKLARFAADNRETVRRARPEIPESLNDRAKDNWESLLAIADIAGGDWPKLAREAALKISEAADDTESIGNELLRDVKEVFEKKAASKISLSELHRELIRDTEKRWEAYNGGTVMSKYQLSNKLRTYGLESKPTDYHGKTARCYHIEELQKVFDRYVSP